MLEEVWTLPGFVNSGKTFFALLFAVSGVSKLLQPTSTERMIYSLHRRFRRTFRLLTRAAAVAELMLAVVLLLPWASVASMTLTFAVFLLFDSVLVRLRTRGFYESCGCFGAIDASRLGSVHYLRNTVLTLLAGCLLYVSLQVRASTAFHIGVGHLAGATAFLLAAAVYRLLLKKSDKKAPEPAGA